MWKCATMTTPGDIEVYQFKFVVDDVANELTQIDLEEARQA